MKLKEEKTLERAKNGWKIIFGIIVKTKYVDRLLDFKQYILSEHKLVYILGIINNK